MQVDYGQATTNAYFRSTLLVPVKRKYQPNYKKHYVLFISSGKDRKEQWNAAWSRLFGKSSFSFLSTRNWIRRGTICPRPVVTINRQSTWGQIWMFKKRKKKKNFSFANCLNHFQPISISMCCSSSTLYGALLSHTHLLCIKGAVCNI